MSENVLVSTRLQPVFVHTTDTPFEEKRSRRRGPKKTVLKTAGLEMHYKMGKVIVPALRGVDLDVAEGEFVSIMGSSGSGKSTLLHVIGGLQSPTKGQVWVGGRNLSEMTDAKRTDLRRQEIGFVFQRFNLFPTLSVVENLKLAERIYANGSARHAGDGQRRQELLEFLGLGNKLKHKPTELSGGEQQRVALARAIINRPSILLADEPTGNLDSVSSGIVLDVLKKLNNELGQTIVMITHSREAADYSERIVRMKDGRITMDSSWGHTLDSAAAQAQMSRG